MLSRIAESLYWIGRYVERAEDTARILDVHYQPAARGPVDRRAPGLRDLLALMGSPTPECGGRHRARARSAGLRPEQPQLDRRGAVRGPANPNRMALRVTGLTVTVAPDSTPPGCLAATNLELQQSNVSASVVLSVPAGSTVTLPAQGATTPRLRLRDLPTVNQDACKHTSFALTYSGTGSN